MISKSRFLNKTTLLRILSVSCICFIGCRSNVALLYTSDDMKKPLNDHSFVKNVRHDFFKDSMVITYKDKSKKRISCDGFWGIKYKGGTAYRYYNDQYYLLRQDLKIQIYSQTHSGHNSTHTLYYFSKSPDGDIYSLKYKNIKKHFQSDTCFLRKLASDLKWYQDYSSYDKKNETFRLVKIYNDCKNNVP